LKATTRKRGQDRGEVSRQRPSYERDTLERELQGERERERERERGGRVEEAAKKGKSSAAATA
jgi:hypothetical protein